MSAGTFGEVLATGVVPKCSAEASMRLEYDRDSENSSAIVAATIQAAKGDPELMALRDNGTSVALLSRAHTGEVHFSLITWCQPLCLILLRTLVHP